MCFRIRLHNSKNSDPGVKICCYGSGSVSLKNISYILNLHSFFNDDSNLAWPVPKVFYPKWQNRNICNKKLISIYNQYRTLVPKLLHRSLENNIKNSLSSHRSHISPCWLSLRPWRARGQSSVTAPQLPSPCCSLRNPSCSCFLSICSFILKLCTALLNHYYNCCFNFGSLSIVISLSSLHRTSQLMHSNTEHQIPGRLQGRYLKNVFRFINIFKFNFKFQ